MDVFKWNGDFETGQAEVDRQHQQLVDIINRFGDLLLQNRLKASDFTQAFTEILSYTEQHFDEEEQLMQQFNIDPRHRQQHGAEHANFLYELNYLQQDPDFCNQDSGHVFLQFLNNWLAYHLLGSDKSLSRQIEAIKAGQNPVSAYEESVAETSGSTGSLLAALSNLLQQVSERNRQLLEMNRTLEQKVAERTRELSTANRNLEELARTDVLTGLPNRRHAMHGLAQLWKESSAAKTPLSCLMIDADGFKEINDNYGHDAGDNVLRRLSSALRDAVRTDDIVCRLGGDEFLVICPDTPLDGALHIAELTRIAVTGLKVPLRRGFWHGSISIGVATRTTQMNTPDDLIKQADRGVYEAKHAGRNCVRTAGDNRRGSSRLPVQPEA